MTKAVWIQPCHFWVSNKRLSYFLAAFLENRWNWPVCVLLRGGSHSAPRPASYRVWGVRGGCEYPPLTHIQSMHAGFSFSYSPISLLLRQPLSIKKSYAGAIQSFTSSILHHLHWLAFNFTPWVITSEKYIKIVVMVTGISITWKMCLFCLGTCHNHIFHIFLL